MVSPHACSANLLNHMVRFFHTSDWQLGMTRHFLSPEAQSRFTDARLQAIRTIGEQARQRDASFALVTGDVFESNMVERQLVLRALQAMKEAAVQFYLLPGNHDPLSAGSVYLSHVFTANCPENVTILDGTPVEAEPGVTIVNAPWRSKKVTDDPIAAALAEAADLPGIKIVAGHGRFEIFAPDAEQPELIRLAPAEAAIASGAVQYIALGDRHSRTAVGATGRIWYSGAPEPTEYRETDPGLALAVTLDGDSIDVESVKVATWRFTEQMSTVNDSSDVARLRTWLDGLPTKERIILNLGLEGTVTLSVMAELEETIEHFRPMFAAIEQRASDNDLLVVPSDNDFSSLGLSGFAASAARDLAAMVHTDQATEAGDALRLLHRLARGAA
ncbi:MAG: exonuclease SbcCD subunit D [Dehalococcoidia bacterium]